MAPVKSPTKSPITVPTASLSSHGDSRGPPSTDSSSITPVSTEIAIIGSDEFPHDELPDSYFEICFGYSTGCLMGLSVESLTQAEYSSTCLLHVYIAICEESKTTAKAWIWGGCYCNKNHGNQVGYELGV